MVNLNSFTDSNENYKRTSLTYAWEKCSAYNAIQNKKFIVNKIVIKVNILFYMSL
jgi:hypothetical protein